MGVLEGERQRVGSARDDDQMNMIRHETIAQQREVMEVRITSKQIEIHCPVGIAGENELPGISTLGNVMGYVDNDDASQASHIRQSSRKRPVCPQVFPPRHQHGHFQRRTGGVHHKLEQFADYRDGAHFNAERNGTSYGHCEFAFESGHYGLNVRRHESCNHELGTSGWSAQWDHNDQRLRLWSVL